MSLAPSVLSKILTAAFLFSILSAVSAHAGADKFVVETSPGLSYVVTSDSFKIPLTGTTWACETKYIGKLSGENFELMFLNCSNGEVSVGARQFCSTTLQNESRYSKPASLVLKDGKSAAVVELGCR